MWNGEWADGLDLLYKGCWQAPCKDKKPVKQVAALHSSWSSRPPSSQEQDAWRGGGVCVRVLSSFYMSAKD